MRDLISYFFQLEIEFYCEKHLCSHFDLVFKVEAKKTLKHKPFRSSVFL